MSSQEHNTNTQKTSSISLDSSNGSGNQGASTKNNQISEQAIYEELYVFDVVDLSPLNEYITNNTIAITHLL